MAVVVKVFEDQGRAHDAYRALREQNYSEDAVALLIPERRPEPVPAPSPAPSYGGESYGGETDGGESYGGEFSSSDSPYQSSGWTPGGETAPTPAPAAPVQTVPPEDLSSAADVTSMLGGNARFYLEHVDQGHSLVVVNPAFGTALKATQILEDHAPMAIDAPARGTYLDPDFRSIRQNAAPLSSLLGFGTLTDHRAGMSALFGLKTLSSGHSFLASVFGELGNPNYSLSSKFGMGMLSSNPAPLSSMFGMSTRSGKSGSGWTRSMGFRMLSDNAAPFSSFFGIPLISGRNDSRDYAPIRHRRAIRNNPAPLSNLFGIGLISSGVGFLSRIIPPLTRHNWALFGMGRLSRNPAPLSSMLHLKVLKDTSEDESMGFRSILDNPTPLSSALGWPVLTNTRK